MSFVFCLFRLIWRAPQGAPFAQLLLKAAQNYKKLWRKANLSAEEVSGRVGERCASVLVPDYLADAGHEVEVSGQDEEVVAEAVEVFEQIGVDVCLA